MKLVAALALSLAACGGRPLPPPTTLPASQPVVALPPPPAAPVRLQLTIMAASIDGAKADGSPWDGDSRASLPPPSAQGPLVSFLASHPELAGTEYLVGEPVQVPGVLDAARKSPAPDAVAFVEVGPAVFRTTMAPSQFQPTWGFPLLITVSPFDLVRLTVVDWDGPGQYDVLGATVIPARDLIEGKLVELPRFGNVSRLQILVEPAPALAQSRRVAVPAREPWTETGVLLVAGEHVVIRATGEVCTGANGKHCSGPEGQPEPSDDNVPGFEARGHGALIGAVGDTRFYVGRELRFVAPSSGPLLLGANDRDAGDNHGQYEVAVDIQ